MPRIAVMTFMFKKWWQSGRMDQPTMLAGFAKLGVGGVEPFHRDFVDDATLLPNYRKWVADAGLTVPVVDVMANLAWFDDTQRQQGRDELRRGLDICKELGATIAHVAGHRVSDDQDPAVGRQHIAQELADAADLAESYGLTLAIEDFFPSPTLICSTAHCLEVMRLAQGHVKFVFDTGNFAAVGERADEVFPQLAEQTVHVHVKDFAPSAEAKLGFVGADLGKGVIPNAQTGKLFQQRNYNQWVALETRARDDVDPVAAVASELPLMRTYFDI